MVRCQNFPLNAVCGHFQVSACWLDACLPRIRKIDDLAETPYCCEGAEMRILVHMAHDFVEYVEICFLLGYANLDIISYSDMLEYWGLIDIFEL